MSPEEKSLDPLYTRLSELYQRDPRQFEKERRRLLQEAIASHDSAHQRRAQGMQFTIDARLAKYRDPVMRMNKMVEIFWEGVLDFQKALNTPSDYMQQKKGRTPGKVLSFSPKKRSADCQV